MHEQIAQPDRPASLARATECQLFLTYLVQQLRNTPKILDQLDVDELRQLEKAVDDLRAKTADALELATRRPAL